MPNTAPAPTKSLRWTTASTSRCWSAPRCRHAHPTGPDPRTAPRPDRPARPSGRRRSPAESRSGSSAAFPRRSASRRATAQRGPPAPVPRSCRCFTAPWSACSTSRSSCASPNACHQAGAAGATAAPARPGCKSLMAACCMSPLGGVAQAHNSAARPASSHRKPAPTGFMRPVPTRRRRRRGWRSAWSAGESAPRPRRARTRAARN